MSTRARARSPRPVQVAAGLTLAGLAAVAVAAAAAATPGSGTTVTAGTVSGLLDGTSGHPASHVQQDGVRLQTHGPTEVTTFELTYPPGSFSGWHSHPGIVVAVVRAGEVVRQTGCRTETFGVGDAFTEVGPHHVSNPSSTEAAVLSITRIYPAAGATTPRIDEPAPTCPGGPAGPRGPGRS